MDLSLLPFRNISEYRYHQGSPFMGFHHPLYVPLNSLKKFLSMESVIAYLAFLIFFLSMGSFMVPLYILRNFFKHGAHPYTWALRFITRVFNPSFYMKKIR